MVPERWLSYVGRGLAYLVIARLTCQLPENSRNLNPGEPHQNAVQAVQPSAFYWYCS